MENLALERAKKWAQDQNIDQESRQEIQKLIDQGQTKELVERFYKDLEFGTGGLRSILGAGNNRMNKYNIQKATQALCNVLLNLGEKSLKAALSYDSRRFSFEFAKEAATVFAANGIKAYIYKRLNPVALLSFSVRHHKAHAGVMVTASHNPPEYNGYKVYWSDGAQVTPPHDQNIIDQYNQMQDFSQVKVINFDEAVNEGLIEWVGEDVENEYYKAIYSKAINPEMCQKYGKELKIVYTPIHGTGLIPCTRALKDLGLTNIEVVKEQAQPDSSFPTVKSPNPENPEALSLAVDLMKKTKADIAFGSDPDTDRLGVALFHQNNVEYLNGNQIGVLMLHYILTGLKESGRLPQNSYFVKTIVTSELQAKIAKSFGVATENTLTGFKWICGLMNTIERKHPERNFIFATEESFGYLNHDFVRDKDGVSSVSLMAEMTLWYKRQNMNLIEALDKIYEQYGFSHETLLCLDYEGKEGAEKIGRIMERFRQRKETQICGLEVEELVDYKSSQGKKLKSGETFTLSLPKSNVLGHSFSNGNRLFLRPSGTEPKIKFYIMVQENEGSLEDKKKKAKKLTDEIISFLKTEADKA